MFVCVNVCVGISALYLIISVDSNCGRKESASDFRGFLGSAAQLLSRAYMHECVCVCVCVRGVVSLVYSLEELPLVFADSGVVDLLHQLGVFVDEPGLPQHVSRCVLYLSPDIEHKRILLAKR